MVTDCLRLRDSVPLPHFSLSPFSDRFSPLIGYRQVRTRTETPPRSRPHFENCWTDRLSSHWICALSPIFKPPVIWRNFSILGEKVPGNVGKYTIELSNQSIWRDFCQKSLHFENCYLTDLLSSAPSHWFFFTWANHLTQWFDDKIPGNKGKCKIKLFNDLTRFLQ